MFFLGNVPSEVEDLLSRQRELGESLLVGYEGQVAIRHFAEDTKLYDDMEEHYLGRVRTGLINVNADGADVLCFEAGDVFSLPRVFGLPHGELHAQADCEIELLHRDDFIRHIYGDVERQHQWSNYLLTTLAIYQRVLSHYHARANFQPAKGFEHIDEDHVIIHEGDEADTVYQLMSGHAKVTVRGILVGEVLEGEIFGCMAVFTGEVRNATVTATKPCTLLSIPKERFVDLIRVKPETAITLLENMSRRIQALNEQVLAAQVE